MRQSHTCTSREPTTKMNWIRNAHRLTSLPTRSKDPRILKELNPESYPITMYLWDWIPRFRIRRWSFSVYLLANGAWWGSCITPALLAGWQFTPRYHCWHSECRKLDYSSSHFSASSAFLKFFLGNWVVLATASSCISATSSFNTSATLLTPAFRMMA